MNVLRRLLLPWVLFFIAAVAGSVTVGVQLHFQAKDHPLFPYIMGAGLFLCLYLNLLTLRKAGIWLAYAIPFSVQRSTLQWFFRAILAVVIAWGFFEAGKLSWMPLAWQAFIIPAVFSLALFVIVRSLLAPVLNWSANMSFGPAFAFILSVPIFLSVPVTAAFLGETIVKAYEASRPEVVLRDPPPLMLSKTEEVAVETPAEPPATQDALIFREAVESGQSCENLNKPIQQALEANIPEEKAYWAARAVRCSSLKMVVGLPKLARLMVDHKSPKVRAAAIRAMPKFGSEHVKRIAYLLVKRISDKEQPEVIEAAVKVLAPLGETETKWAIGRLKTMLMSPERASVAAQILSRNLKREELVANFVTENLPQENEARKRAAGMICQLSKANRELVVPYVDNVVASIATGAQEDPAVHALECLGTVGFEAIQKEVAEPRFLERTVAARALATMDVSDRPEFLQTADNCSRDANEEVRRWCSESLGKLGGKALPRIIDLLKSNDPALKEAGRHALNFFDDPTAKEEIERLRSANSGWMATRRKLQINEALGTALVNIESRESVSEPEETTTE